MSPKRKKTLAAKKARKEANYTPAHNGLGNSKYAKKCRGIYPPNSPYRTIWAEAVGR